MRVELPIVGGYEKSDPLQFMPAETINLYTDYDKDKENGALFSTPGLDLDSGLQISGSGGVRQLYISKLTNYMHAVVGENIYAIDSALNYIFGIKITTNSGYIGIDETINEILIVDGIKGYLIDKASASYSLITDADFPALPQDVVAYGNRFYVINGETNEIYFSDSGDGTKWNTLNKFELTSYPDIVVGINVLNGQLYVFGKRCVEVWSLQGASFPVARDSSALIEYGCTAPGTIAVENGVMIWLGYNKQGVTSVVATKGGRPERISTTEIGKIFQSYKFIEDVRAFMYWENGILFYQLNFTLENSSFLFNLKTKEWSMLEYNGENRHRAECFSYFNGQKYVGDYEKPYIYNFNTNYYSDNNIGIKRKRITTVLYLNKGEKFICKYLRFILAQGVGLQTGKDEKPTLKLRISRDNGATFGNQLSLEIGKLGATSFGCEVPRLGLFEYGTMVLELEFYNQTSFTLIKCYAEVEA